MASSTINTILNKTKITKNDLITKCKELGIGSCSKYKKEELITIILNKVNDTCTNIHLDTTNGKVNDTSTNIQLDTTNGKVNDTSTNKQAVLTVSIGIQVSPDDFKCVEAIASFHNDILDNTIIITLDNIKKCRNMITKTILKNDKYKYGDVIINEHGLMKLQNNTDTLTYNDFDMICKTNNKKVLVNLVDMHEEIDELDLNYLKNINYDKMIIDMYNIKEYKYQEFLSPLRTITCLYAKINNRVKLLEKMCEYTDPPFPVLSDGEILEYTYY